MQAKYIYFMLVIFSVCDVTYLYSSLIKLFCVCSLSLGDEGSIEACLNQLWWIESGGGAEEIPPSLSSPHTTKG